MDRQRSTGGRDVRSRGEPGTLANAHTRAHASLRWVPLKIGARKKHHAREQPFSWGGVPPAGMTVWSRSIGGFKLFKFKAL